MKVSRITLRSFAIQFFFVFVFFSVISISHFVLYSEPTGLLLPARTAHHINYALQSEDSDSDFENDNEFAKLHAVWTFLHFPAIDWHSHPKLSYFIKDIEIYPSLPRSPPV